MQKNVQKSKHVQLLTVKYLITSPHWIYTSQYL